MRLIEDDESESEEESKIDKRASPAIPLIAPIPIRPKPGVLPKDLSEVDKENVGVARGETVMLKSRFGLSPPAPLRDSGNVTVTLTLSAAAAEDIASVLRNLANILRVPPPSGYQIVERTTTPPSQKLGLYRTKGKDGKEGDMAIIQSILNGATKFCRHCDVVIMNNLIRKKVSDLPFLSREDLESGDDLYFCSTNCYMQFALTHRSSVSEEKAATIVDHLCDIGTGRTKSKPSEKKDKEKEKQTMDKEEDKSKDKEKVDEEKEVKEEDKDEGTPAAKVDAAVKKESTETTKEAEVGDAAISVISKDGESEESSEAQAKSAPSTGTAPAVAGDALQSPAAQPKAVTPTQQGTPKSSEKRSRKHTGGSIGAGSGTEDALSVPPPPKVWKGVRYKLWSPGVQLATKYRKPSDREMTEMLFRLGITVMPEKIPDDKRKCMFCHQVGDGVSDGPARLLNYDVDQWVHLNCALWSDEVYETVNGALMNLEAALRQGLTLNCALCRRTGATVRCFKARCSTVYHLGCAVKDKCVFFKNKTTYCPQHVPKNEKENELTTLSVFRRVYVNRDENRQIAKVMHYHQDPATEQAFANLVMAGSTDDDPNSQSNFDNFPSPSELDGSLLRVGSLIFLSVGHLLPHQLQAFHTPQYIYPIGYKIVRFYWSMRVPNKRCRYVCSIHESKECRPEFRVRVQEPLHPDIHLVDNTARGVWGQVLEPLTELRRTNGSVRLFPRFVSGEDLFGLTEPAVVRVLESLPGVENLSDYRFRYGRNPLLELPLAMNPSGCARGEPRLRGAHLSKRPHHTQRTASASAALSAGLGSGTQRPLAPLVSGISMGGGIAGEPACPYSKQFVHSKSSQYKKMKQEWRNNVYLARSKIQGLGLYAARDIERHTMVIEYIGEIIRTELAELREKQYEARNRGIYMFRLDEDRVIDATLCGGLARYINHSCNPNCAAEIVEVERDLRIIIFAKRRISRGEELAYDYKFDIEDDQHKIPCLCGAFNCKKWMN
ncbi:hypothetical protein J437_LFUL012798 [Ladona fulva]|uniref:Histone-lysine N-methyltransferase trr n=1 Tax=Ladona fulva TaxID=123851 RepID=A0A8K0P7Z2_LADFU|nr:hypothetical protein J437_LFUL012798 [Ladona fulva]